MKEDWLTPPLIIKRLGQFDLDPCASVRQPWRTARRMVTLPVDGLTVPWAGRVWLNPPFKRKILPWAKRLVEHGNGVILVPARTESQYFQLLWQHADAIFFSYERWMFHYPRTGRQCPTSGWVGCALAAFGKYNANSLVAAGLWGNVVMKNGPNVELWLGTKVNDA